MNNIGIVIDSLNMNLIQNIRFIQALNEIGLIVKFDGEYRDAILNKFNFTNYSDKLLSVNITNDVSINHPTPFTTIFDISKPLIFPKKITDYCKTLWKDNRTSELVFIGNMTNKRKNSINASPLPISYIHSMNGRDIKLKMWDDDYFEKLSNSKFTVCLDGGTYRFFEACLCGSIPVIENTCSHYKGFKYYTIFDNESDIVYDDEMAKHNYDMAIKTLIFTSDERKHIFNSVLHMINVFWWKSNNAGDNITPYLYSKITGNTPKYCNIINNTCDNYISTGSILSYANENSIVWGSGFIDKSSKPHKVRSVLSVRGPLTRDILIKHNIDCPEVYGDPGLLVSFFYKPNVIKKYKYGFIPHYVDKDSKIWSMLKSKYNNTVLLDIQTNNIEQLMDDINECDIIISSSLHGIIFSDSYGIPNVALKLSSKVIGDGFKFYDYFKSVGRDVSYLLSYDNIDSIDDMISKYTLPVIDFDGILDSCPWRCYV